MSEDTPLSEKVNRLETIIERLEDGDVSLDQAKSLHEEGQSLLEELQNELDIGDGLVIEND